MGLEHKQKLLQTELAGYDDYIQNAKQAKHDLRHHNALLLQYLNHKDYNGAEKYLHEYDNQLLQTSLVEYCSHPVANAVFKRFANKSDNININISVEEFPANLPLSDPEIGVLLSNLLENAVASCDKVEKNKFIDITSKVAGAKLFIEQKNSVAEPVSFDKHGLPKTNLRGHGTGCQSINSVVKKYNGMVVFSQKDNIFFTQIVLPNS